MRREVRKYRVTPSGHRGVTVIVAGSFDNDQAWRDAARDLAGYPSLDASYAAEKVVRLFPWWTQ